MNKIVYKFLLTGEKFMSELRLQQLGFTYGKDLGKTNTFDNILKDRAYEIAINPQHGRYETGLATMVYGFFNKKKACGANINKVIAHELHKKLIRKFK